MKFIHPDVDFPISICAENPYVLVIEHPEILSNTISDLIHQVESGEGNFALFIGDKKVNFKGNVVFFDSCHRINFNDRTVWNRINTKLHDQMLSEYRYEEYARIKTRLYSWIEDLIFDIDLPIHFNIDDFNLMGFVKSLPLYCISSTEDRLLEQMIDVMKLYTSTINPALYIFQNLKSYLKEDELDMFYQNAIREKHRILLIENQVKNRSAREKCTIIDYDRCVI